MPESKNHDPNFSIVPFAPLHDLLWETAPPFDSGKFRQLDLIERHLKKFDNNSVDKEKSCKSIAIEEHYIDRAFMEDYKSFYSTSFKVRANSCKRLHFFSLEPESLRKKLNDLFSFGRNPGQNPRAFRRACEDFSDTYYLGFSVIKPLGGTPVGRTVLREYKKEKDADYIRKFNCTREYKVHLGGIELCVKGLVFQQQDIAVSACATTALWSSLSKLKEFESLRTPSPAKITELATQHFLPFGRPMPQDNGLSTEQMCQAVQSLGLSPYLVPVSEASKNALKGYLHSAIISGFAPILIMEQITISPDDGSLLGTNESRAVTVTGMKVRLLQTNKYHAVTITGMKARKVHRPNIIGSLHQNFVDDYSGDLEAIYVNDDRLSPYFRVKIGSTVDSLLDFENIQDDQSVEWCEHWKPTHILIPLHSKIRLSFQELRAMAGELIERALKTKLDYSTIKEIDVGDMIGVTTSIRRSYDYRGQLFYERHQLSSDACEEFNKRIRLSRYIGVVRLIDDAFGVLDVLVDTTCISTNPNFLGIVVKATNKGLALDIAKNLSDDLQGCPIIFDFEESEQAASD